jgi:hypothetical protein
MAAKNSADRALEVATPRRSAMALLKLFLKQFESSAAEEIRSAQRTGLSSQMWSRFDATKSSILL